MTQQTLLTNPVIRGFAPDPSIVRIGEWYFVAVSSFEWFPTIPIHRSRDLIHWEYAGHVENAVPGGSLAGYADSAGVWAPALSVAGGRLWATYSIVESLQKPYFNLSTYITTAAVGEGVLSDWDVPVRVPSHGFDPSLFHHDGRSWLLNLQNDHRPGGDRFSGIVLTELDRSHGTVRSIGRTRLLLQSDTLIEGPKLLFKDGWFYLAVAEGGTGVEHGVRVARSRAVDGPYEVDGEPLLTTRDDPDWPLQKAGHGEFVQASDGSWYLTHLVSRPIRTPSGVQSPLGRETAVQAIVWDDDGWPRLAQGGWHPAVEVAVPEVRALDRPVTRPAAGPAVLDWPWSALRAPATSEWVDVLDEDTFRLRGRQGIESWRANSLVGQRLIEHHAVAEVTVEAHPTSFAHSAGLVLWYNASAYISLQLTWAEPEGERQRGQQFEPGGGRIVLVLTARSVDGSRELARSTVGGGPFRLRAELDHGTARFAAGRDGSALEPFGPEVDASFLSDDFGPLLRFTGTFAAVNAFDLVDEAFTATFSRFTLTTSRRRP
ncbi:family 43 glycosylhydrolase [Leifsonia sp. 2MCAF36]|uniref:family 43 glycosylhydrolase n=1 Tax=Leifsonia sp. 2MCAF36 TaxID=3232988 RepID=UPI003F9B3DAE